MESSVLSGVRMRVERRLMSSTVPILIAETANVADVDNFVCQKRNASEKIFQSLLGGKRDCNSADPQAGKGGGHVEAESAEYEEDGEDENKAFRMRSPKSMSDPVPVRPL